MTPLRVAVNLTWMVHGQVGGSEQYLTRQLSGLNAADFDLTMFTGAEFAVAHPDLAARHRTVSLPEAVGGRGPRILAEHSWLAWHTRDHDVVHHGGGTAPLVGAGPIVLTVHDLQYLTHPAYFSEVRRRYLAAMMPRSVRRAALIAVPTTTVRSHLLSAFGVSEDRVVIVPHGVPATEVPSATAIDAVRRRHGVGDRPYVVYPAITHPHKRHRLLVEMLDRLDGDMTLVLIGGRGPAEPDVASSIAASAHRARIVRPGRVTDADRNALVAGADALVFPSEFEGFGAPLVEAMAFDTPVVCSDADAVVEVVGDAAVVVSDASAEGWAAGVAEARRRCVELVERGRRRRTAFTIERSAEALAAAYRQAARS